MAAEGHAPTAGEYIVHHLHHLQNKPQHGVVDFSVYNLDSIFWAVLIGVLGSFLLWSAARKATSGVPGRAVLNMWAGRRRAFWVTICPAKNSAMKRC